MPSLARLHRLTQNSLFRWMSLIIIPAIVVVVGMYLKHVRGPYWLGSNYDPDYAYLMNALNVVERLPIWLIGHPGTPLQVLIALMMRWVHLIRNHFDYDWPTLETDVLSNPEIYLQAVSYIFLIINALLVFAIGLTCYRRLKQFWLALLLQAAPFFSSYIPMNSLVKVAPETLLLTVVLLLLWLLVFMLGPESFSWRRWLWYTIGCATIVGLGIATKMNFIPMVVLPLCVIRTVRLKSLYLAGVAGFFFLFTLPIRSRYAELFEWLTSIFKHTGIHGAGTEQIIVWSVYWSNLKTLIDGFPYIFAVILLFCLIVIVNILVQPRRRDYVQTMAFRIGVAATITQLFAFVFIAKHMIQYYFLPFVPLTAIIVCCALIQLRDWHQRQTATTVCLGILFVFFAGRSVLLTYSETKDAIAIEKNTKIEILTLRSLLEERYSDYTVFHYFRSSSPEFALSLGNDFVGQSYNWEFTQRYPDYYTYDISSNHFLNWDTVIDMNTFLQANPKVILTGSPFETAYVNEPQYRPNLTLTDVFHGTTETFYIVSQ